MKIVVPVSRSDADRLDIWLSTIEKFSGLDNHSFHFIPTFSVATKAYEAAGRLGKICKDTRVTPLDMDNDYGWPKAPNWQWFKTVSIMEELSVPWFWMELDCYPARQGWASEIGSAYAGSGSVFLGCLVPTPHKDEKGVEVPSPEGPDDKMMCGCGIYPSNLVDRIKKISQMGLLEDLMKGSDSADNPWDLHLRAVMRKLGMGHTNLIADHWNTVNYRVEDGKLICDAGTTHSGGSTAVRRAGIINPAACVIHGCKDDSLAKLIMEGLDTRALTPLVPVVTQDTSIKSFGEDPRISQMQGEMAELKAMLKMALTMKPQESSAAPTTCETNSQNPPASDEELVKKLTKKIPNPAVQSTDAGETDKVIKCLKASKKQLRLAQVSGLTKLSQERIRELSQFANSQFEIGRGALAWMKLKSLTHA